MTAQPYWHFVADLPYPPEIKKLVDASDKAWTVWEAADLAHELAVQSLIEAQTSHAAKLTAAAEEGAPFPGELNVTTLQAEIDYKAEIARARRVEAENLRNDVIELMRANREAVALLAIDQAEQGKNTYRAELDKLKAHAARIEAERRNAYEGVRMVAQEIDGVAFDIGTEDYAWPKAYEQEVSNAIMRIKRTLGTPTPEHSPEALDEALEAAGATLTD
jgi:hypothetical protein